MTDYVFSPGILVYLAGVLYVFGLITINQIVLRLWLLGGTGIYIFYYAIVADAPLWEAIYVSMMIGAANLIGLSSLLARKMRLVIPRAYADIYDSFPPLPPGDFRALVKLARRFRVEDERQVTTEGQAGDRLYYVISGATRVQKGDREFIMPPQFFLGEIAFLIGQSSSASAWLEPGSEVLEWRFEDLRRKCARSSRFRLALEAAISVDLARKVSRAVGPNTVPARSPEPRRTKGAADQLASSPSSVMT
ncbi:cyclic nucleotide-binding domain-containing protein [uncultured Roseobacter sp.]|uniref:Crp/Fnr family transcriptional regulator n=1 Tax=uncultured Roseobacter sp. TaxID=114847 RepID=UPI00262B75A3|nr:cyclic nucleotide-binding domain-containing protein [uncultured Roseobacter sp.]